MTDMVVTTSSRPSPWQRERAAIVATRCRVPHVTRRGSLSALLDGKGALVAYVVRRDRECLADGERSLFVDQGLLHARVSAGRQHPLIRALGDVRTVVDGTLGLAQDALHIAAVTGAQVVGFEAVPALACLCESGLARLAAQGVEAAARIVVVQGDSRTALQALGRVDAMFLSPMFDAPQAAAPGWDLLRPLARPAPLDAQWLQAALQVAPRVVVKVRRGLPPPLFTTAQLCSVIRGKAVDYWRIEAAGSDPT